MENGYSRYTFKKIYKEYGKLKQIAEFDMSIFQPQEQVPHMFDFVYSILLSVLVYAVLVWAFTTM